jgi:hypothetical protein
MGVIKHIVPVAQPKGSNLCWAAVTAMILGRSGNGVLDQIVAEAKTGKVPLQKDMRLDPTTGVAALARVFKLSYVAIADDDMLSGERIVTRLTNAPCGLMGQQSSGKHAVACHGMVGEDLTASSTSQILGVDPRGFTAINMDFFTFQKEFRINWILYK